MEEDTKDSAQRGFGPVLPPIYYGEGKFDAPSWESEDEDGTLLDKSGSGTPRLENGLGLGEGEGEGPLSLGGKKRVCSDNL